MNKTDKAALKLAMKLAMASDPARTKQLRSKLEDEPWIEVAQFAAYSCQYHSLRLKPWERPPCHADEDEEGPAGELLRRMLRARCFPVAP
jgi:hypothetical protein